MSHVCTKSYSEKRRMRELQVKRQKNMLYSVAVAVILVLIVIVCVKLSHSTGRAEASLSGTIVFESVNIEKGDTLWSIAKDHKESYMGTVKDFVEEVIRINGLQGENIMEGESLIIPVYVSVK